MAIRDMDTAAAVIGIRVSGRKLLAHGGSSFFCGIADALWMFGFIGTGEINGFDLDKSSRS